MNLYKGENMKNYFKNIITTIDSSFDSLDEEILGRLIDDLAESLNNSGKIIATGLGKNVPICEKFVGTLNSLGISSNFLNTNNAMHGDLGIVKENDIVLMLSKSGNTKESIDLANNLIKINSDIWLISFNEKSQLSNIIENKLILDLDNEGDDWDIVPNNSSAVYLILLQGISMMLKSKLNIKLDVFKRNHPGGFIGKQLKKGDENV